MSIEDFEALSKALRYLSLAPILYLIYLTYKNRSMASVSPKDKVVVGVLLSLPIVIFFASWIPFIIAYRMQIESDVNSGKTYSMCGVYEGMQYFPKPKRADPRFRLDDGSVEYGYSARIDQKALKELKINDRICVKYIKNLPFTKSDFKMIVEVHRANE